jgi:hypothetical protein
MGANLCSFCSVMGSQKNANKIILIGKRTIKYPIRWGDLDLLGCYFQIIFVPFGCLEGPITKLLNLPIDVANRFGSVSRFGSPCSLVWE